MRHARGHLWHAAFAAACLLAAPAALAQKIGHYEGTNAEGGEVDVYVASDGSGGCVISSLDDSGTVYCRGTSVSLGYGVGFGGFNTPITDGMATFDYIGANVYFHGTFDFSGNKVSGKAHFGVPLFTTTNEPPKKASSCLSKNEKYTATFVGSDTVRHTQGALAWPLGSK